MTWGPATWPLGEQAGDEAGPGPPQSVHEDSDGSKCLRVAVMSHVPMCDSHVPALHPLSMLHVYSKHAVHRFHLFGPVLFQIGYNIVFYLSCPDK